MPFPTQSFPDFISLMNYIDTYIIPNGIELIDGEEMNNVTNGLLAFIEQSPLNYQKALVINTTGVANVTQPINVFITNTPSSLQWVDNIYNQYVFVNTTNTPISIGGGLKYYDINLNPKTTIPAKTIVSIAKASNNLWISIYNAGGSSSTVGAVPLQFKIGDVDSPMEAGDTELVITVSGAVEDSEFISLDGAWLYRNLNDRISYEIAFNPTNITITFNQEVANGQLYLIKYLTT